MWPQLITARVKDGRRNLRASGTSGARSNNPGSGLVLSTFMRDEKTPGPTVRLLMLVVFESAQARAR